MGGQLDLCLSERGRETRDEHPQTLFQRQRQRGHGHDGNAQKKYGTTEADRSGACKNSVPAKWINGVHGYIKHPVPYFGYWVSDEAGWYDYKNGETVSGKKYENRPVLLHGLCPETAPHFIHGRLHLSCLHAGPPADESYEADLLWKQSGLKNNGGYMDVLLYIDAQGKRTDWHLCRHKSMRRRRSS